MSRRSLIATLRAEPAYAGLLAILERARAQARAEAPLEPALWKLPRPAQRATRVYRRKRRNAA